MAKKKRMTDKELLTMIEKKTSWQNIIKKMDLTKQTLQRRVQNLIMSEKRFIEVEGLFQASVQSGRPRDKYLSGLLWKTCLSPLHFRIFVFFESMSHQKKNDNQRDGRHGGADSDRGGPRLNCFLNVESFLSQLFSCCTDKHPHWRQDQKRRSKRTVLGYTA